MTLNIDRGLIDFLKLLDAGYDGTPESAVEAMKYATEDLGKSKQVKKAEDYLDSLGKKAKVQTVKTND